MDLFEAFGLERKVKKLDEAQTRSLINEIAAAQNTRILSEHTISGPGDDINDMDAGAVWDIMTGDDEGKASEMIKSIGSATTWGAGALAKAGVSDAAGLKAAAEKIWKNKETFTKRVGEIVGALGKAQGYPKPEMPAFEGGDVDAISDALGEPGPLNIDIGSDFGGGEEDFDKYYKEKEKSESSIKWLKMAGLYPINELKSDKRFPFPGPAQAMDGAPNLGDSGSIDIGAIKGKAKEFLTKGKGNAGDDLSVEPNQPMAGSAMKPTQTNVKAAKSMLFALADIGEDMGGAYASSDGDILDGHHRWSGQYLRTGGSTNHTSVHIIDKGGMDTKTFLTMLSTLGAALGRPTKLK